RRGHAPRGAVGDLALEPDAAALADAPAVGRAAIPVAALAAARRAERVARAVRRAVIAARASRPCAGRRIALRHARRWRWDDVIADALSALSATRDTPEDKRRDQGCSHGQDGSLVPLWAAN